MTSLTVHSLVRIAVSLLPVFLFLAALIFLDSYRLVRFRSVLLAILVGSIVSAACYFINNRIVEFLDWERSSYSRYGAPFIEEFLKAGYLFYLLRRKKIGFMVDAAIYGFAIGSGFAFIENIYYLNSLPNASLFVWVVRGLGTAVMHGGTTAIVGIISKNVSDRKSPDRFHVILPGLVVAVLVHSFYNHFFLSPFLFTVLLLMTFPLIVIVVFNQSEKATRNWLGVGFDTDTELLEMIMTGNLSGSNIGLYLQTLKNKFPGEVVADMLCLLRLQVELSMRAKGTLLMRETGFRPTPDPEIKEKFQELRFLEKSIGKTGKLAILPFLHRSSRDLWQLQLLDAK